MVITVQVLGAVLVLTAFALSQTSRFRADAYTYLMLNLVGATLLTASALVGRQWGFVLLNTAWMVVALVGLVRRGRRPGR